MISFGSTRISVLKKLMVLALTVMPVFLMSACGGIKHMIDQPTKPRIAPKADKATLVIVRTTSYGWGNVMDTYLDGKMIGQTLGKSYFITEVKPGSHYVMGKAENIAVARINFEAGRVYFLNQGVFMGVFKARTGFSPLTAQDGLQQTNEEGCDYRIYDTAHPGEDMDKKDYEEAKADFEKEVKEDPARHKDTLSYKGYSKL